MALLVFQMWPYICLLFWRPDIIVVATPGVSTWSMYTIKYLFVPLGQHGLAFQI